jgi:hypothetical protein
MATTNKSVRYVVDALMADLTSRHHHLRAVSEKEAERRMRTRYPEAAVILVHQERSWRQGFSLPGGPVV